MTNKPAKKLSPFYTKGIYLYALPIPAGLLWFTLFQMWHFDKFFVMVSHLYEVVMLVRFCLMLYLASVVSLGFLVWLESKGG